MKTIKMREKDWQKWDSALRSGEYAQGKGYLCEFIDNQPAKFCCLGVLQHCLTGETEIDAEGNSLMLPSTKWRRVHNIKFFSGVKMADSPTLPNFNLPACAANDSGKSFVEIADAIKDCVEFI